MQCDICFRTGGQRLPFLCPTDARNLLYEPRVKHARVLLEKDGLDKQISGMVSAATHLEQAVSDHSTYDIERATAERDSTIERTQSIIAQADELRFKVDVARAEIARRKAAISRRKSELASANNGLEARRAKTVEDIDKGSKMKKYRWDQMHVTTAQSRAYLCGEAAKLHGLQRLRNPEGGWLNEYSIAGVPIVDLPSMNSASAAQITTSLSQIAHLLVLSTHYLAIRLPAEITLPHRDYPLPTILPLSSSHIHTNLPFPGNTPSHSSNTSPSASRHEGNNLPRPRPLFITKPLPLLAKEDPVAYGFFLEGAVLLAYNIAWVCKSQGIPVGSSTPTNNFEDICSLGRNLFELLIATTSRASLPSRVSSNNSTPTKPPRTRSEAESEDGRRTATTSSIGNFSHGSSHTFLGSREGNEFVRGFKLLSPTKVFDKLKSQLLTEVASAEWEVVDKDAWAEGQEGESVDDEGDGVLVGARKYEDFVPGRRRSLGLKALGSFGAQSFMSMRTVVDAVEMMGGTAEDKRQGTNGWTKVKPR
jgi:hypothetical protein